MDRIPPTGDLAFKKVFASIEHTDVLGGLINDFFGIVAEEIAIANPYSIEVCKSLKGDISQLRYVLRDIAATFKTADFVSEMQMYGNQHPDERFTYYLCKRFCGNYGVAGKMKIGRNGKPNPYSSLRPVYALNILDFTHYDDNIPFRVFGQYDHVRNLRPKKEFLHYACFELTKTNIETENQRHWHDYFKLGVVKPEAPEYIKKASDIIEYVNLSEEERNMADALEKARDTMQDELDYSFFEGKDEGKLETALSMLQEGDSPEKVAKCTKFPLERILQLQSQLQIQH
jgi:predicted transposase/invertase (TIGR01784 family)